MKPIASPFSECLARVRKTPFIYLELINELNTTNEGNQAAMDSLLQGLHMVDPEATEHATCKKLFLFADQMTWTRYNTIKKHHPGCGHVILLPGDMHFHIQTIAGVFKLLGYVGVFKLAEKIGRHVIVCHCNCILLLSNRT